MMRSTLMLAAAIGLLSCAAPASDAARVSHVDLPLSIQGPALSLRAEVRDLGVQRVNLVMYLVARTEIALVRVDVRSRDPRLHVNPAGCDFRPLTPPQSVQTNAPPHALPAVPLCSIVLEASAPSLYPVRVRIRDAAGTDLIQPIETAVDIKRGSS